MDHAGVSRTAPIGTWGTRPDRSRPVPAPAAAQMTEDGEDVDEYLAGATAGKVVALAAAQ